MLGKEIIERMDKKFPIRQGGNLRQWEYLKAKIFPEEEYEVNHLQVSWQQFTNIILEKWVMNKMKDIC